MRNCAYNQRILSSMDITGLVLFDEFGSKGDFSFAKGIKFKLDIFDFSLFTTFAVAIVSRCRLLVFPVTKMFIDFSGQCSSNGDILQYLA